MEPGFSQPPVSEIRRGAMALIRERGPAGALAYAGMRVSRFAALRDRSSYWDRVESELRSISPATGRPRRGDTAAGRRSDPSAPP